MTRVTEYLRFVNYFFVYFDFRLTLAFFSISGLDILNSLSSLSTISPTISSNIIEWIYRLQILPGDNGKSVLFHFKY